MEIETHRNRPWIALEIDYSGTLPQTHIRKNAEATLVKWTQENIFFDFLRSAYIYLTLQEEPISGLMSCCLEIRRPDDFWAARSQREGLTSAIENCLDQLTRFETSSGFTPVA